MDWQGTLAEKLCATMQWWISAISGEGYDIDVRNSEAASAAILDAWERWEEFFGINTQSCSQAAGITTSIFAFSEAAS